MYTNFKNLPPEMSIIVIFQVHHELRTTTLGWAKSTPPSSYNWSVGKSRWRTSSKLSQFGQLGKFQNVRFFKLFSAVFNKNVP